VIAVAVAGAGQRHALFVALGRAGQVSLAVLGVGVLFEAASFAAMAELQRRLLSGGGVRARFATLMALVWASNAVGAVLPAGSAASSVYSYRHLTRRGTPAALAGWLLAASGVLSIAALGLVVVVGAQLRGLLSACPAVDTVEMIALVALLVTSVVVLARASARPRRLAALVARVRNGAMACRRVAQRAPLAPTRSMSNAELTLSARAWATVAFLAILNWAGDGAVLAVSVTAVGAHPRWLALVLAYAVSQLAVSLPLLPGSIGIAEGSLTLALVCAGVRAPDALAATLIYRLASFWLQLPPGWAAWAWLKHPQSFDQVTTPRCAPPLAEIRIAAAS
jgi:uncharacterized protein (TIRG00374 family)